MNKQPTENVPGYSPPTYGFGAKVPTYVGTAPGDMPSYLTAGGNPYNSTAAGFPTTNDGGCLPPSAEQSHAGYHHQPPPTTFPHPPPTSAASVQLQSGGAHPATNGPTSCLPMLIDHNSSMHGISSHQVLVRVAEGWMQTFYTMLSTDPTTVTSLYLNDAQAIYTGQEINMDAELMTGISEIAAFFASPSAAKFHNMRVIVDALHPLSYPGGGILHSYNNHAKESNGATELLKNPFTCVTLFIRGRLWLHAAGNRFLHSSFYHNLLLYLVPGAAAGSYRVANEHFHLNQLPLSARPIPPIIYQTAPGAFPATANAYFACAPTPPEIPPLAQPPPAINSNLTSTNPSIPTNLTNNPSSQDNPLSQTQNPTQPQEQQLEVRPESPPPERLHKDPSPTLEPASTVPVAGPKPKRIQTGEASVHAYPEGDGLSHLPDAELIEHLNSAFADAAVPLEVTGESSNPSHYVASVIRVTGGFPAKKKSWFFVNLANVAVRNAVLNRGAFPVNGIQVRFSTIRQTRTSKGYTSKGSGEIRPRVRTASRDAGYSDDKSSLEKRTDTQSKQRAFHGNKIVSTGSDKKQSADDKGNANLVVRCNKPPRVVSLTTSSNTSASHFRRFHNRGSLIRNNFKNKPAEEQ